MEREFFGVVLFVDSRLFFPGLMVSVSSVSNDRSRQKWYRRRPFLVKAVFTDLQKGSYAAAVYSIVSECVYFCLRSVVSFEVVMVSMDFAMHLINMYILNFIFK